MPTYRDSDILVENIRECRICRNHPEYLPKLP